MERKLPQVTIDKIALFPIISKLHNFLLLTRFEMIDLTVKILVLTKYRNSFQKLNMIFRINFCISLMIFKLNPFLWYNRLCSLLHTTRINILYRKPGICCILIDYLGAKFINHYIWWHKILKVKSLLPHINFHP